jgi:mannose/fructose-specific phosphotransferase system component IIA
MATPSVLILARSMAGSELLSSVKKRLDTFDADCHTLTFNPEAKENIVYPHISGRIKHIDNGAGVLVLVDSDATHQSLLQRLADELSVVCVTGLNEAMIAALAECDGMTLKQMAQHVKQAAQSAITLYSRNNS